jgi:hypothetical protein
VNGLLALVLVALGAAPNGGPAAMTLTGAMDKEVIRRAIRSHVHELEYCYERELKKIRASLQAASRERSELVSVVRGARPPASRGGGTERRRRPGPHRAIAELPPEGPGLDRGDDGAPVPSYAPSPR